MSKLPPISLEEIDGAVADADGPVLSDFWAPWCGYCMRNMPIVEQVAEDFAGRVSVYGLNVDDNEDARDAYGIRSIPSYLLIARGEKTVIHGSQTRKALTETLTEALEA